MKNISNKLVAFGEFMMRLNCPSGSRLVKTNSFDVFFGGAEATVCVLLSRLGINTSFVTALPPNDFGYAAIDQLRSNGVDTSSILLTGDKIGLYFTENGNSIRPGKVLYDRKQSSFANLSPGNIDWNTIFENAGWFHWSGISSAVSQSAAGVCLEALKAARQKGLTTSVDFNYRSTLWDYGKTPAEIMPTLLSYCDVVTADIDASEIYLGIKTNNELSVEDRFKNCAVALKEKLPAAKTIAMSFRGSDQLQQQTYRGALFQNNECFFTPVYTLPVIIDRLGSGDAFESGLIFSLMNDYAPQDSILFATACGALKHSIEGDFAYLTKEEINNFTNNGPSGRVIR